MQRKEQLWTSQIHAVLSTNPATKKNHLGVYPCDRLPDVRRRNDWSLVVNTQPSTQGGEHWIAIYRDTTKKNVVFYDSYGLPVENYRNDFFNRFFKETGQPVVTNLYQYQQRDSYACGHHAIYGTCFYRITGKTPFQTGESNLSPKTRSHNDRMVVTFASTCADTSNAIPDHQLEQCNMRMCDCNYCK